MRTLLPSSPSDPASITSAPEVAAPPKKQRVLVEYDFVRMTAAQRARRNRQLRMAGALESSQTSTWIVSPDGRAEQDVPEDDTWATRTSAWTQPPRGDRTIGMQKAEGNRPAHTPIPVSGTEGAEPETSGARAEADAADLLASRIKGLREALHGLLKTPSGAERQWGVVALLIEVQWFTRFADLKKARCFDSPERFAGSLHHRSPSVRAGNGWFRQPDSRARRGSPHHSERACRQNRPLRSTPESIGRCRGDRNVSGDGCEVGRLELRRLYPTAMKCRFAWPRRITLMLSL